MKARLAFSLSHGKPPISRPFPGHFQATGGDDRVSEVRVEGLAGPRTGVVVPSGSHIARHISGTVDVIAVWIGAAHLLG